MGNVDLELALEARGLSREQAVERVGEGYIQEFLPVGDSGTWRVITFQADGVTPRRTLDYPLGNWTEPVDNTHSTLFGNLTLKWAFKRSLERHTSWVSEPDATVTPKVALVTTSITQFGEEEARRYLRDGKLVLKRCLRRTRANEVSEVWSEEIFERA